MRPEERPFTCVEMNLEAASTSNVLDERTGEQWGQDNPVREAISRGEVGKRGYLPAETVGRRQKMIRYPGGEKIARWGQDVSLHVHVHVHVSPRVDEDNGAQENLRRREEWPQFQQQAVRRVQYSAQEISSFITEYNGQEPINMWIRRFDLIQVAYEVSDTFMNIIMINRLQKRVKE